MNLKMSLTEKTVQMIGEAIVNGFYNSGDRLPNEMELSEELGISRATLREAIKVLVSKNVLEVRRGVGTFVAKAPGLGNDPLGLAYIDLKKERKEIIKLCRQIFTDVLDHMQLVDIKSEPIELDLSLTDLMTRFFQLVEEVAVEMDLQFKVRILKMLHEALQMAVEMEDIALDKVLTGYFSQLSQAMSKGDKQSAIAAMHAFWDMFYIYLEEAK